MFHMEKRSRNTLIIIIIIIIMMMMMMMMMMMIPQGSSCILPIFLGFALFPRLSQRYVQAHQYDLHYHQKQFSNYRCEFPHLQNITNALLLPMLTGKLPHVSNSSLLYTQTVSCKAHTKHKSTS